MIVEIVSAPTVSGMLNYNEEKVEQGHAVRIDNTLGTDAIGKMRDRLNFNVQQNERLRGKKFQHVIVSFHKSDEIDNAKFMEIWDQYKTEMNYDSINQIVYQHHDTHLNHYHIVMPTVDITGKKLPTFLDFVNNRDICRSLEVKHNLYQIIYEGFEHRKQHSMNADNFSIYNLLKSKKHLIETQISIGKSLGSTIRSYKLDNSQIKEIYSDAMNTPYDELKTKADSFVQSAQGQLIQEIQLIKKAHNNYASFESDIKDRGLYVRRLGKSGSYSMVYGNPKTGSYVKNNKLPKNLRYDYLFTPKPKEFSIPDQIKFIKNMAFRSIKGADNLDQYFKNLATNNIEVITKTNKNGIYAYSLKSKNLHNGEFIKSSDIHKKLTIANLKFGPATISKKPAIGKTVGIQSPARPKTGMAPTTFKALNIIGRANDNDQETMSDEIRKRRMEQQEREDSVD